MKAPKYIAVFVCLFFAFAIVQGFMWHWVPESDWQPSWWQLHSLATLGFIMQMPALLPMQTLPFIGVRSFAVAELTMIAGFVVEFALIYFLVYFPAKYLFKTLYGRGKSKPVA